MQQGTKKSLAQAGCRVEDEYPQFSEGLLKCYSLFQLPICVRLNFFKTCFNQNNITQQTDAEADMRIHLSSIKPDIKEIYENVQLCHPY